MGLALVPGALGRWDEIAASCGTASPRPRQAHAGRPIGAGEDPIRPTFMMHRLKHFIVVLRLSRSAMSSTQHLRRHNFGLYRECRTRFCFARHNAASACRVRPRGCTTCRQVCRSASRRPFRLPSVLLRRGRAWSRSSKRRSPRRGRDTRPAKAHCRSWR